MFATVIGFPLACLGFVIWMSRLEDSLPLAVRRSERTPDPEPILAIPLAADPTPAEPSVVEEPVRLPVQRSAPLPEPASGAAVGPGVEQMVDPLADPAPGVA